MPLNFGLPRPWPHPGAPDIQTVRGHNGYRPTRRPADRGFGVALGGRTFHLPGERWTAWCAPQTNGRSLAIAGFLPVGPGASARPTTSLRAFVNTMLLFSIYACHLSARAMPTFSALFHLSRMISVEYPQACGFRGRLTTKTRCANLQLCDEGGRLQGFRLKGRRKSCVHLGFAHGHGDNCVVAQQSGDSCWLTTNVAIFREANRFVHCRETNNHGECLCALSRPVQPEVRVLQHPP